MRSASSLVLSAFLLFSACEPLENPRPDAGDVSDAGVEPDAGEVTDAGLEPDAGVEPDAGQPFDAGVGDVDWRTVRGAPWQTTVVGEYPGARPFAMSDAGFVLVSGCDAGACDYEFRDRDGALLQKRTGLRPLSGTTVSPTGAFASLFDATPSGCTTSDGSTSTLWSGSWHLVDLETGDSRATLAPFVTRAVEEPAFLRLGLHASIVPAVAAECELRSPLLRTTTAPYAAPEALGRFGANYWVSDELPDGSLLADWREGGTDLLRLVDARGAAHDVTLSDDWAIPLPAGNFMHTTYRQPARAFTTFDLVSRRSLRTELPWTMRGYNTQGASGRYVVFCDGGFPTPRCEVRDGLQEREPVVLTAQSSQGRFPMAIAGKADFVVYAHDGQLWRRSLLTGVEVLVHSRVSIARSVGGGRAVYVRDGDTLLAVEADRVFTFPGALRGLIDAEALGASYESPNAATLLVVTASATGGENWLHAWNTATGRIARLTDSLFLNAPFQAPLTAADLCNAPGYVRSAGSPFESAFVRTKLLHFTEFVPQAQPLMRLFVMPVDLSAPPRLIAEVPSGLCGTPLATPSGDRVWMPVPMPTGGVRGVMATP